MLFDCCTTSPSRISGRNQIIIMTLLQYYVFLCAPSYPSVAFYHLHLYLQCRGTIAS
uniref:Uncharacterized protein n=1 Tax=Arundo donax TaxID=35708 RepID=A0A0A9BAZ3_ARUDO